MLRLRVLDKDGEAVPGATVSRDGGAPSRERSTGEAKVTPAVASNGSAPIEGDLELWATKTGWRDLNGIQFRADGQEHVITMQRALGVSGHVTDSLTGQPIPEFKVFPGYDGRDGGVFSWDRSQTRRGMNGQFTVHLEPPLTFQNALVDDPSDTSRFPGVCASKPKAMRVCVRPVLPDFTNRLDVALERLDPAKSIRARFGVRTGGLRLAQRSPCLPLSTAHRFALHASGGTPEKASLRRRMPRGVSRSAPIPRRTLSSRERGRFRPRPRA